MSGTPQQIAQGSVVWAEVADKNGFRKRRPVVIITATGEILLNAPIVAAAITTSYAEPPPPNVVELPWTHYGHPATGLRQRSAAVCDWLVTLLPGDVQEIKGYVPTKRLLQVIEKVKTLAAVPKRTGDTGPRT